MESSKVGNGRNWDAQFVEITQRQAVDCLVQKKKQPCNYDSLYRRTSLQLGLRVGGHLTLTDIHSSDPS